ncbi:hypothetical protein L596_023846 [Steinernema carpocapsae]|uniref:UBC core domain-containing protein n=1 Tax=Steinernema carpocapsae TaxID=34508 RepID=A0A4V5ZZJ6_STECR|nr:hypothetical protein L596_023846 [Steinernema carpocapsae]
MPSASPPKKKHGGGGCSAGGQKDKKRVEKQGDSKDCGIDKDFDASSPDQLLSVEAWDRIKDAAANRLKAERAEVLAMAVSWLKVESASEGDRKWTMLMMPKSAPYNAGAFRIVFEFSHDWPYKPPNVFFSSKIYHPNVDEKGVIFHPLLTTENWKPTVRIEYLLRDFNEMITSPRLAYGGRNDVVDLFASDHQGFMTKAVEFTKAHTERRPG